MFIPKRCASLLTALVAVHLLPGTTVAFVPKHSIQTITYSSTSLRSASTLPSTTGTTSDNKVYEFSSMPNEISEENPLRVLVAGAGVGGLALAKSLSKHSHIKVTVLERTDEFKRFGGPIQLASNALQIMKEMDQKIYAEVMEKFTFTGNKENGIKDGIRNEWYAKFDLASPAETRNMPYTGVIERPDLQNIYLANMPAGTVQNGDGVVGYVRNTKGSGVVVKLESGATVEGDVLIGADGIWSAVRATMRDEPVRGDESGVAYSGYTVFAGELAYASFDNGLVGYKVYIGPGQYFVITDIGNGRYQWYAFLAREPGSSATEEKPDGSSPYLQNIFTGWSDDIHHILKATKEDEIEQRDLYDRPPSVRKPWTDGPVALLGDAVHAMMPNLGQGGCQAIEDAFVIAQELEKCNHRDDLTAAMARYRDRRLVRSAAVQGLSRFASDIIIRGFDTPAKIVKAEDGSIRFENFNYAGIVTSVLRPILPIFFAIQFAFLYDGYRNEYQFDGKAAAGFLVFGGLILLLGAGSVGEVGLVLGPILEGLFGAEGLLFSSEGLLGSEGVQGLFDSLNGFF
jgi:zeaxanthin epoxidase